MRIKAIAAVLALCLGFAPAQPMAEAEGFLDISLRDRWITLEGRVGAGNEMAACLITGQDTLNQSALLQNTPYAGQLETDADGGFSKTLLMPAGCPPGEYMAVINTRTESIVQKFNYITSAGVQFHEDFTNGISRWDVQNMGIVEQALVTKSEGICSAVLKGDPNAFWDDLQIDMDFSLSDFSNGWFQLFFRDDGKNPERLLIRRSGISRLLPDGCEQGLAAWSLTENTVYHIRVCAQGEAVTIALSDQTGAVLGNAGYPLAAVQTGRIGVSAFRQSVKILEIAADSLRPGAVRILEKSKAMTMGEQAQITYSPAGAGALRWESGNPAVAKVGADGAVLAAGVGTAVITAVSEDGIFDRCIVVVTAPADQITLSGQNYILRPGEHISIRASLPAGADESTLRWKSSNPEIASLFGSGYSGRTVCAEKEGAALITAYTAEGGASAQCRIQVDAGGAAPQTYSALFEASEHGRKIPERIFGVAHEYTNRSAEAENLLQELGFRFIRTFGPGGDYPSGYFDFANHAGIPQMIAVPVAALSVSEILDSVKQIEAELDVHEPLYIELGNEVFDGAYASAVEYMQKCREVYAAIKAYNPSIRVGAVIIGEEFSVVNPGGKLGEWNRIVAENPDFYDAVIVHHYITFNDIDGMRQDDMMQTVFLWNAYHRYAVDVYAAQFPGKDIWVSEYGTFFAAVFRQTDETERARMAMGKTVGAALGNLEQALDLLTSGKADMCSYHILEDSQGFGIIQGENKLPNYYVFQEISTLLGTNGYAYPIDAVQCETKTLRSARVRGGTYFDMESVGAWGFGDADALKYAVFLNRTKNPAEITLAGKKLKPVWQYGGGDVLPEYLVKGGSFTDPPEQIPAPVLPDSAEAPTLTLGGYTAVVCKVSEDADCLQVSASIPEGIWDFEKSAPAELVFSDAVEMLGGHDVTLTGNGKQISLAIEKISDRRFRIMPVNGWDFDCSYILQIADGIVSGHHKQLTAGKSIRFQTMPQPENERYQTVFYDDFSGGTEQWSLGRTWKINQGRLYKSDTGVSTATIREKSFHNFELTFDLELGDTTAYAELLFRGGSVRFYHQTGLLRSYFHGVNDEPFAKFTYPASGLVSVRLVARGSTADFYMKEQGDAFYTYVGSVQNLDAAAAKLAFQGSGQYSVDNVAVKADAAGITKVDCYQMIDGARVQIDHMLPGRNFVEIQVDGGLADKFKLLGAVYLGHTLVSAAEAEKKDDYYLLTVDCAGEESVRLLLLDSLDGLSPLDWARPLRAGNDSSTEKE